MANPMKHDDQNKDAQSGRPVELEKEQKGGKQGEQQQGGEQHQTAESR